MRLLPIILLFTICLSQSEEWIYYNNISNNALFPTMVHPDGTDSTSLADSSILWDVNETGTKFLYGVDMGGSNLIFQDGNNSEIFSEDADQARFNSNGNVIVYRKEIHPNKKQIISYSLIDSTHTVIVDSMPQNYSFVLSPDKDRIMYFNDLESNREILIVNIIDGNSNTISNIPSTLFYALGTPYIWALNDLIYFEGPGDSIVQLFSIDINDENPEPTQLTFFGTGCYLIDTYENYTNKIIVGKPGVDTLYTYNIVANNFSPIGPIPGFAMNYTWSTDMSKVVFSTMESITWLPVAGPLQVFDINTGNVSVIPSMTGEDPIFWRQLNTVNLMMPVTPYNFSISQNYPNPFNPITNINFELAEDEFVNIVVYDILGNIVNNLIDTFQSSGYKSIQWDATNNQGQPVSAGVYLYSIEAGNFRQTKKMILLK